eukprot:TRINITY_DN92549_c0_g1_i1.p1 TRINITY_DN92549_c0_g1~~TRINITY_DN92549_c0_g1_i1.p1  ORF type:complete len:875 (+),score=126.31 TRINITY_DN92549_c0_g1_i1:139-2625(+)
MQTTEDRGSRAQEDCGCQEGFYSTPGSESCFTCPEGLFCSEIGIIYAPGQQGAAMRNNSVQVSNSKALQLSEGFMSLAESPLSVFSCVQASVRCPGLRLTHGSSKAEVCQGNSVLSPRCGSCAPGFFSAKSGSCEPCSAGGLLDRSLKMLLAVGFEGLVLFYIYMRWNKPQPWGIIAASSLLNYMQMLQTIAEVGIDWPPMLAASFSSLSSVLSVPAYFGLFDVNLECNFGHSPFLRLLFESLMPLSMVAFFVVASAFGHVVGKPMYKPFIFNSLGTIFAGLFISFSRMTLNLFLTDRMPNDQYTLQAFPTVVWDSPEWLRMIPVGLCSCAMYSGGFFVYCSRAIISAPASAVDPTFFEQYRFLFKFRPGCFWWLLVPVSVALSMNVVQAATISSLDILYLKSLILGIYSLMIAFFRPFKHRLNNYVELLMQCSLLVIVALATAFATPSSGTNSESNKVFYETIMILMMCLASAAGLVASCTWIVETLLGTISQRRIKGAGVDTLLRYRDIIMESFLHGDAFRSAGGIADEDLRVLDNACKILVPALLRKQYKKDFFSQQVSPGAPPDIWNGRSCTATVMAGAFSGDMFNQIRDTYRVRLDLYTLTDELHALGEHTLHEILQQALRSTMLESPESPAGSERPPKIFETCLRARQSLCYRFSIGQISRQSFSAAVVGKTTLSSEQVKDIFNLVDDGTGHAAAQDLRKLLNSAHAAIAEASTSRATVTRGLAVLKSMSSGLSRRSQYPASFSQQNRECNREVDQSAGYQDQGTAHAFGDVGFADSAAGPADDIGSAAAAANSEVAAASVVNTLPSRRHPALGPVGDDVSL